MQSLIEDTFQISNIIKGQYKTIARIQAISDIYTIHITLDLNKQLLSINKQNHYQFEIQVNKKEKGDVYSVKENYDEIFEGYDYVCHGSVFEVEEGEKGKRRVVVSFGGLLMKLEGKEINLKKFKMD